MKLIAQNKKAGRELHIEEKFEAGMVLTGTEIKSIRTGKVVLDQAYVQMKNGEAFLVGANIAEYAQGSFFNHAPTRRRKLLLHKRELRKLEARVEERGATILPMSLYINDRGLAKLKIGVGRGKKLYDKRHDIKKREISREIDREMKRGR